MLPSIMNILVSMATPQAKALGVFMEAVSMDVFLPGS